MNPLLLLIPVAGVVGYIIYSKTTSYAPPPGTPAVGSGGVRYQSYISQLNDAMLAYRAAKVFGGDALVNVIPTTKGTLDVVGSMAQVDLAQGNITTTDLANINAQIAAFKKEIG